MAPYSNRTPVRTATATTTPTAINARQSMTIHDDEDLEVVTVNSKRPGFVRALLD
jgi:hypothetical protein